MEEDIKLTDFQLSILQEVGSICTCNTTTALAQLLGKRIDLEMPHIKLISITEIAKILNRLGRLIIGIHSQILGAVQGNILLIFPGESAFNLMDLLGEARPKGETKLLGTTDIDLFKEIGIVIIASYLSALNRFADMLMIPSAPELASGDSGEITKFIFRKIEQEEANIIFVETVFKEEKRKIKGDFFLVLESESIRTILKAAEWYLIPR